MATANPRPMNTSKGINSKQFHGRVKVDAQFCPTDVDDLFSTVDWEVRSAQIKGENGELIFEQTNCENSGTLGFFRSVSMFTPPSCQHR